MRKVLRVSRRDKVTNDEIEHYRYTDKHCDIKNYKEKSEVIRPST